MTDLLSPLAQHSRARQLCPSGHDVPVGGEGAFLCPRCGTTVLRGSDAVRAALQAHAEGKGVMTIPHADSGADPTIALHPAKPAKVKVPSDGIYRVQLGNPFQPVLETSLSYPTRNAAVAAAVLGLSGQVWALGVMLKNVMTREGHNALSEAWIIDGDGERVGFVWKREWGLGGDVDPFGVELARNR